MIKRLFICILCALMIIPPLSISADNIVPDEISSVILIEAQSGSVLYEKDADLELAPASVTKVMTLLLIMEAIDSGKITYDDMVSASAYATSMGGSQVYLKENEEFSVRDMIKSITMASANDCCVAMAEHLYGSEEAFVVAMNDKAKQLGMEHTNFENTTGLDDTTTNHYTSARDIAIMSRELIVNHPKILEFTSVWMDSIRDGAFGLTNTNRLVRFYKGANGLKTGSTSKAGFCISASAYRNNMELICVIMKAPSRDVRNETAKKVLDYGFSNFSLYVEESENFKDNKIIHGIKNKCDFKSDKAQFLCEKGTEGLIEKKVKIDKNISAPIKKGDKVGKISYLLNGEEINKVYIRSNENISEINYFSLIYKLFLDYIKV